MNIHIKSYLLGLAFCGVALTSCESFDSINLNPNDPTPETVDPTFLLTPTMIKGTLDVDMYQRIHNLYVDNFAQYFANDKYASNNCVPVESWTQDFWNMHWQWIDALNEIIKNYSDDPKLVNTVQIARIWKVWLFHRATDLWGDIPYFKAADGSGLAAPYDPQKDIYYDMFKELAEASAALDVQGATPGKGDLIFNGDITRWKSFANSLRLRLAMRLTEVDPAKAKEEAEAAVTAGALLASNNDNVKIWRCQSYIFDGRFYYANAHLFNGKRQTMSYSMEKLLTGLGGIPFPEGEGYTNVPACVDPRGPVYFNVTNEYNGATEDFRGRWKGVPSGLPVAERELPENSRTNNSRIGVYYVSDTKTPGVPFTIQFNRDQILMYYAEICFLRAEGALRGWNMGGSAKEFYEEGIKASMAEAGIPDDTVDKYMQSTMPNAYGTTVPFENKGTSHDSQLEKIITQKYFANFPDNGWEAWNDYRRLNIPDLEPFVAPEPGYVVKAGERDWRGSVRRITYPAQEAIVNEDNYNAAVSRIGEDKTTTRMWWDAKQ